MNTAKYVLPIHEQKGNIPDDGQFQSPKPSKLEVLLNQKLLLNLRDVQLLCVQQASDEDGLTVAEITSAKIIETNFFLVTKSCRPNNGSFFTISHFNST